jgi:hypothetical protein
MTVYGILVPQQLPDPIPPPHWVVRLRQWFNKFRTARSRSRTNNNF